MPLRGEQSFSQGALPSTILLSSCLYIEISNLVSVFHSSLVVPGKTVSLAPRLCNSEAQLSAMASKSWQFVNMSEPAEKKSAEVRQIVRANAMRDFRKKQKHHIILLHKKGREAKTKAQTARSSGSPPSESSASTREPHRPKGATGEAWRQQVHTQELGQIQADLRSMSLSKRSKMEEAEFEQLANEHAACPEDSQRRMALSAVKQLSGPNKHLGCGNVDPFDALPVSGNQHYNSFLMHHFASIMAVNCLPLDPGEGENAITKVWLPYALQEPAMFVATLTFSAVHLEILNGSGITSSRVLAHKGNAITAVNARLNTPELALSNETIGVRSPRDLRAI